MEYAKFYNLDDYTVLNGDFEVIGKFKYTNEVEGLTEVTKDKFKASLHLMSDSDRNDKGFFVITNEIPLEALEAASARLYRSAYKRGRR